jgi:CHASE3 domain sensor protein
VTWLSVSAGLVVLATWYHLFLIAEKLDRIQEDIRDVIREQEELQISISRIPNARWHLDWIENMLPPMKEGGSPTP